MKKIIGIVVLGAMVAFSPMALGGGGHGGGHGGRHFGGGHGGGHFGGGHGGGHFGGGHNSFMPSRGGATFSRGGNWSGRNWSGRNWSGGNWGGSYNQSIFIGGLGFPFFYGYPY